MERGMFVAAHFGLVEYVHPLVARFQRMLQSQKGPNALPAYTGYKPNVGVRPCLPPLVNGRLVSRRKRLVAFQ